jgi:hypothetical protein
MNQRYFLFIFSFTLFVLSCNKSNSYDIRGDKATTVIRSKKILNPCKVLIEKFNYPIDLERLDTFSIVCETSVPFSGKVKPDYYKYFSIIFSDKNYLLVEYDLFTRLLYDKRENVWFVFKSIEAGVFDFLPKKKNETTYGPGTIFVLDSQLMPIYAILPNRLGLYKFYNNDSIKKYSVAEVRLLEDVEFDIYKMSYDQILNLTKILLLGRFTESKAYYDHLSEYFYDNPPVWTESW